MPLDFARIRELVDQLEQETSEAAAARADLDSKTAAVVTAQDAQQVALTAYTTENDQRIAKQQEIIAELQSALGE